MTTIISRGYSTENDLQLMINLLVAVRSPARITDYPGIVDLRELFALPVVQDNTRLWFDVNDQLCGFAFVDTFNNLRFEFDQPDLEFEIVRWGETCIRRAMSQRSETLTLDASCRDDETAKVAMFERHGFVQQAMRSLSMVCPLDKPLVESQVPSGFHIRHLSGVEEVADHVALHRAAFGTNHMTVAKRLAMMQQPEYDPQLDLIAVAADGRFAAYCVCSISQEENMRSGRNEGYTDPIATHPDFQQQGLAKALLLTGCRLLKQRGVATAVLGTSSANVAMQKTAQSAGFYVQTTKLWFAKPVTPG